MKQEQLDKLYDITGQISESYIAEAMPRSQKDAHKTEDIAKIKQTASNKEEITMATRITRYITTGFAAAAAIGMVIGGGFLIGHLNRQDPKPGQEGSSAFIIETEPATTAATSATSDSASTTTTEAATTAAPENVKPLGYAKVLTDTVYGMAYLHQNGSLSLEDYVISDGTYGYKTEGNQLIRVEDGKVIGEIENPQQYLTVSGDSVFKLSYDSVTAANGGWYLITAEAATYAAGETEYPQDTVQLVFWFNPDTNQNVRVEIPGEPVSHAENKPHLLPQYMQAEPEGDYVVGYSMTTERIVRIPVPGKGNVSTPDLKEKVLVLGQFFHSEFTPIGGGKLLMITENHDDDVFHIRLEELDMNTGSVKTLMEETPTFEIYNYGGRIYCISQEGHEVMEYLPESNTFRTVLTFKEQNGCLTQNFTAFWGDEMIVNGQYNEEETFAIHVTSIKNGTYEFLQ